MSEPAEPARARWLAALPDQSQEIEAFSYEVLARISWSYAAKVEADPGAPLYPLQKPFGELSWVERDEVTERLKTNGGVHPPPIRAIFPVPTDQVNEPPAVGWIRFAFEFDPIQTPVADVLTLLNQHLQAEIKQRGIAAVKGNEGRRHKPPSWQTLEELDACLRGEPGDSERWRNARNLVSRYAHLWPRWYLSDGDPDVWARPDAQGFLQTHQGEGAT